ncbi:MAG: dTDP-4-dehydrorhamnose 3,5-epimerase family protein [Candidatus Hodarchaeota archaeon]
MSGKVREISPIELDSAIKELVKPQDYSSRLEIRDVKKENLKRFLDDGGEFIELGRVGEKGYLGVFPHFEIKQLNYSLLYPGTIKAWHIHIKQDDVWFIPPISRILVGLVDCRADSETKGVSMRFILGEGRAELLYIPRGVAHGLKNIQTIPGAMFYFVNQHFSSVDTDELRLPWNHFGHEFWEIKHG